MSQLAFPVDLVYTWVDGGDEARRAARMGWLARSTDACIDAAATNRIRDHIVVSGGQRPRWMLDHPKIQLGEDAEIFLDRDHLPTFNSQAIECHLDRVPGLADHYLYVNDDFLFCRPVGRRSYFLSDRTPLVAFWRYGWTARIRGKHYHTGWRGQPDRSESAFVNAWINVNDLLDQRFGARLRYVTRHHAPALRKGMLSAAARFFPEAMERTSRSRCRAVTDVTPIALPNTWRCIGVVPFTRRAACARWWCQSATSCA